MGRRQYEATGAQGGHQGQTCTDSAAAEELYSGAGGGESTLCRAPGPSWIGRDTVHKSAGSPGSSRRPRISCRARNSHQVESRSPQVTDAGLPLVELGDLLGALPDERQAEERDRGLFHERCCRRLGHDLHPPGVAPGDPRRRGGAAQIRMPNPN